MNNERRGREQDIEAIRGDWVAVGEYLSSAMYEVATELGGEELATQIAKLAASDDVLPNPAALKMLEDTFPGSTETIMERMSDIQQEQHQREIDEIRKPAPRKLGKAMVDGFASFNIFGYPTKKH